MGFSRQGYWSGLPFPSPGDLPDPGFKPWSYTLQADSLPSEPLGLIYTYQNYIVQNNKKFFSNTLEKCVVWSEKSHFRVWFGSQVNGKKTSNPWRKWTLTHSLNCQESLLVCCVCLCLGFRPGGERAAQRRSVGVKRGILGHGGGLQ